MNNTLLPSRPRRSQTSVARRQQLLAEFDRSGLSATAFALQQRIPSSTFCNWLQKRARRAAVSFTEIEVIQPSTPEPLVLELGPQARLRLSSAGQLELAARLLKHLQA